MLVNLLLSLVLPLATPAETCARGFGEVLDRHVAAIEKRDLDAYLSTIAPRDGDLMILPDGTTWDRREEIADGHREWFADPSWTFVTDPVRTVEREDFGLAVFRVEVRRPDREANPFLLSILFAREDDGCWYLMHDQNTPVPEVREVRR